MKLKQVINLFGAPGCGKSTIASGLFYKMKINGVCYADVLAVYHASAYTDIEREE